MENLRLYIIRCLTNMHVGSGEVSYTLVDKQVQRDIITGFPTINSSSLKGSLKSFLKSEIDVEEIEKNIKYIFGDEEIGIGLYKIFPGMLLTIPVRSNVRPFFRATCPQIIRDFTNFIENFQCELSITGNFSDIKSDLEKIKDLADKNNNSIYILKEFNSDVENTDEIRIEGFNTKLDQSLNLENKEKIIEWFGENLIIINDNVFYEIIRELPIIARNKLNDGESENLWYEEVVPRETRFYFGTISSKESPKKYEDIFNKITEGHVQIGGNATIGYGYCDIKSILNSGK